MHTVCSTIDDYPKPKARNDGSWERRRAKSTNSFCFFHLCFPPLTHSTLQLSGMNLEQRWNSHQLGWLNSSNMKAALVPCFPFPLRVPHPPLNFFSLGYRKIDLIDILFFAQQSFIWRRRAMTWEAVFQGSSSSSGTTRFDACVAWRMTSNDLLWRCVSNGWYCCIPEILLLMHYLVKGVVILIAFVNIIWPCSAFHTVPMKIWYEMKKKELIIMWMVHCLLRILVIE